MNRSQLLDRISKTSPQSGRVEQICSLLTQLAKEQGPRTRLPSVKRLRETLGASTSTLDRALTELERRQIIEREHGRGIFVSTALRSKSIGILMEINPILPRTSPSYAMRVEQAEAWATRRHYGVRTYINLPYRHGLEGVRQRLIRDVQEQRIDGVLVAGAANFDQIEWLQKHHVPCVYHGVDFENGYRVEIDIPQMVRLAVEALRKRGCQRIGLVGQDGDRFDPVVSRKQQAFLEALQSAGLPYDEHYCKRYRLTWQESVSPESDTPEQLGRNALLEIWQRFEGKSVKDRPDGMVVTDDLYTRGLLAGMHQLGLMPDRDLKIATIANRGSPTLACYENDLIQIEFDVNQITDEMLEMLGQLMAGKTPVRQHVKIEPALRESSRS